LAFFALVLPLTARAQHRDMNSDAESHRIAAPLRVSASNPRYFADAKGRLVYLTGSHNWDNLLDRGERPAFDYKAYLDLLRSHGHNFIRLWTREQASLNPDKPEMDSYPHVYQRTGPGTALDGKPKFDLTQFNPVYFQRLRSRVEEANDRGIYVMVMLFNGFSVHRKGGKRANPWPGHPFNSSNNINGIDGDINHNGQGEEVHTLQVAAVTRLQEAYVRRVVDTVNDLGVLYEISNESHRGSLDWQYHMIRFVHEYENTKPNQNPVVMTAMFDGEGDKGRDNAGLFASPAEAIAPGPGSKGEYIRNPPPADGNKIIISDTDHLWGVGGDVDWVWKSFLRGLNPIFMDPIEDSKWDPIRRALGKTALIANRINLSKMVPRTELASTGYCLANPGAEYLVYLPEDSHWLEARMQSWLKSSPVIWRFSQLSQYVRVFKLSVEVDVSQVPSRLEVSWFNPATGEFLTSNKVIGGHRISFTAPFTGPAVLHLRSTGQPMAILR
jgi:hypothetical protein